MKQRFAVRVAAVGLALSIGVFGRADAATADTAERARIGAERAAAETVYRQRVQACGKQFAVTSCVDAARAQRYAAFSRLDRELLVLDDARRTQRAAERQQAIDSKVGGDEARKRAQAARERSENRRASGAAKPLAPAASAAAPRSAKAGSGEGERAEQEARARRTFELKQIQAEAHRREVEQRNAERASKAKRGLPLPTPAPAASAVLARPDAPAR